MKLTRHNGRSGRHGVYNPRHNDRRFDLANSEHINTEMAEKNIYWDCYRGYTIPGDRENEDIPDFCFERIEQIYYTDQYGKYVNAQNERNMKNRHPERCRTTGDLLKNNKTCPEESIYQIGTMGESVPPKTLVLIAAEFYEEFEKRYGSHVHILDWALHLDEGRRTSMNGMSLTARTVTANSARSRKRRWRNSAYSSRTRTGRKAGTITASRRLTRSAGSCFLRLRRGTACIWTGSRPMAGGAIWKNRILSLPGRRKGLRKRNRSWKN